jgi:hypothetical protein
MPLNAHHRERPTPPLVSIVVPFYDEAASLPILLGRL